MSEVYVSKAMLAVGLYEILLGVSLFVVTFAFSLVFIGMLLVLMPAKFFLDSHDRNLWVDHHPVIRWLGHVVKNAIGLGLIAVGVLLSLPGIPGQGILTILIGLVLLDIPGKRRLERKIVSRPGILRAVNRLRARFGRPPLQLEEAAKTPSRQG